MANKLREIAEKIKNSDKKLKIFVAIGIIGILLILLSEAVPAGVSKNEKKESDYSNYVSSLEEETKQVVESIDGVGKCVVMITLKASNENVYARNTDENNSSSSISKSDEYVFYKGDSGETPVLLKEYFPQINGIAVVCSGADNYAVKESIISCLSSVFDIPTSKISVTKIKGD